MFEKDYLMRLIQTLLDAINKIVNSIDKGDIEGAKTQLSNSYRLLGNEEDYFSKTDFKELIENLNGNYTRTFTVEYSDTFSNRVTVSFNEDNNYQSSANSDYLPRCSLQ